MGTQVVSYEYDTWGKLLSVSGTLASTIGELNPFRYRGYYYDSETGLYYLNSRYYDPVTSRYLNADSVVGGVGGNVLGYNLFAYCFNNPVNMDDPSGHWPIRVRNVFSPFSDALGEVVKAVGKAVVAVTKAAASAVANVVGNVVEDAKNAVGNTSEETVLQSNYFSTYKGKLVVRLPIGSDAFSFGAMFIGGGNKIGNGGINTVKHEYGHTKQFDILGPVFYTFFVAIPSVTNYWRDVNGTLPRDYYSYPWESTADQLGGVIRYAD